MVMCKECNQYIDTDYDAEHFIYGTETHDPEQD